MIYQFKNNKKSLIFQCLDVVVQFFILVFGTFGFIKFSLNVVRYHYFYLEMLLSVFPYQY